MRNYSDSEVRALLLSKEKVSVLQLAEAPIATERREQSDTLQFVADLEFESKFAELIRSIARRWPRL